MTVQASDASTEREYSRRDWLEQVGTALDAADHRRGRSTAARHRRSQLVL